MEKVSEWEKRNAARLQQLNVSWERYLKEKERMQALGQAIGTFSAWQYENGLCDIKIDANR